MSVDCSELVVLVLVLLHVTSITPSPADPDKSRGGGGLSHSFVSLSCFIADPFSVGLRRVNLYDTQSADSCHEGVTIDWLSEWLTQSKWMTAKITTRETPLYNDWVATIWLFNDSQNTTATSYATIHYWRIGHCVHRDKLPFFTVDGSFEERHVSFYADGPSSTLLSNLVKTGQFVSVTVVTFYSPGCRTFTWYFLST